jgi:hypothetical protein
MPTRLAAAAMVMATMWAIATATRLACNKDGKGKCGKGHGNGDEGGR